MSLSVTVRGTAIWHGVVGKLAFYDEAGALLSSKPAPFDFEIHAYHLTGTTMRSGKRYAGSLTIAGSDVSIEIGGE